jgi:hypothetical protein
VGGGDKGQCGISFWGFWLKATPEGVYLTKKEEKRCNPNSERKKERV